MKAQQIGDAYILFNFGTGEFRMNPGNPVGSNGVNSFGVEMDSTIGTISTDVNDYYFPSGSYPLFPPQTGANPGNAFGSAFQSYSLPNVTGGGDSLNSTNLVIGSEWAYPTSVPGSTAVFASTITGYEGLPEFSFGTFGPTDLTESQALAALGATTQGGFATGNRVYSLSGTPGNQFFKIYTTTAVPAVPEPSAIGLVAGLAVLGASVRRRRKLASKA